MRSSQAMGRSRPLKRKPPREPNIALVTNGVVNTQEKPFRCRYCPKCFTRADVVVRHEKDIHWEQYVSRSSTNLYRNILSESTDSTGEGWSTPSREPKGAVAIPSRADTAVERPLSPCIPTPAAYPSSPSARIQEAIATLDFTTLHAAALSLNYTAPAIPSPPPELEFMPTDQTPSGTLPSTPSIETDPRISEDASGIWTSPGQASNPRLPCARQEVVPHNGDEVLVPDEDILALGPMFDPLWDPIATKKGAIAGYVADLHREMLVNAGLLGK
ncbi:hypothetical protein BJY01DRAFT_250497 [Aspergillus pseudoustus]|uniref:C2H2-type domain-containing protein n=1 Tax=Aspergillus pseudoustus TaxID=1810923 RepID=A0ABR4JH90_9EURO